MDIVQTLIGKISLAVTQQETVPGPVACATTGAAKNRCRIRKMRSVKG